MVKINSKSMALFVVVALFALSVIPGEGMKSSDQMAIVSTEYTCNVNSDCPICVGSSLGESGKEGFINELASASCSANKCQLPDTCLIWDCGKSGGCTSIRQSLFDNTIVKLRDNPLLLLMIVVALSLYFNLGEDRR